jgi:Flp pilus assembly protein TadG
MNLTTNKNKQCGVVAIEFALVIIPLMIIVFGITEFGRAFTQYNTIAKSARDAARYLSTQAPGNATGQQDTAACIAVYGEGYTSCSGAGLLPGLTTAMVQICDATSPINCPNNLASNNGVGTNMVTLTIGGDPAPYSFVSFVPFIVPNINFGPISVTMPQAT